MNGATDEVRIESSLPPNELLACIDESTGKLSALVFWNREKAILSSLKGGSITLRCNYGFPRTYAIFGSWRSRMWMNSWAPEFHGQISDFSRGSVIVGSLRIATGTRLLMAFWVLFFCGAFAAAVIQTVGGDPVGIAGVIISPIMIVAMYGMYRFGRHLARNDDDELINFLRDIAAGDHPSN